MNRDFEKTSECRAYMPSCGYQQKCIFAMTGVFTFSDHQTIKMYEFQLSKYLEETPVLLDIYTIPTPLTTFAYIVFSDQLMEAFLERLYIII